MRQLQFHLTGDYIELNKLLKFLGVAESGGAAKALVASGAVTVDGNVELRKACKIREGQTVRTAGVSIAVVAKD